MSGMIASSIIFFLVVFATFFVWNRLAVRAGTRELEGANRNRSGLTIELRRRDEDAWRMAMVGTLLACLLFAVCFAIGVWFSIARLKGDGWSLSV